LVAALAAFDGLCGHDSSSSVVLFLSGFLLLLIFLFLQTLLPILGSPLLLFLKGSALSRGGMVPLGRVLMPFHGLNTGKHCLGVRLVHYADVHAYSSGVGFVLAVQSADLAVC
jgi:hypothetical protein